MAEMYWLAGLVEDNKITSIQAQDIIGSVVGATAPLTEAALKAGMKGVIIIDEAHLLGNSLYFLDFLQVFLQFLVDNPTTVVILVGYEEPMKKLMEKDEGLDRRFPNHITLQPPTGVELSKIFVLKMQESDYKLDADLAKSLPSFFEQNRGAFPRAGGDIITFVNSVTDAHGFATTHFRKRVLRQVSLQDFQDGFKAYKVRLPTNKKAWGW